MTNDPRDPLGGQQPGMPDESSGSDSGQAASSGQTSGQGQPGGSGQQPGRGSARQPGQGSGQQPGQGATPTAGASASGARSTPSGPASEERTYAPQETSSRVTATQTYETPQASRQAAPPRTYEAPRRNTKMMALLGIVGVLALGGLIAGLVASNSSTPTAPAAIRTIPHAPVSSRGHLVASVSGTGVRYSAPFKVTRSPVTATYSYRCTSGTHGFIAALAQSRSNITPITSTRGGGAARTVSVSPRSVGSFYRVAASSPCPYHVSVFER
jgi:hypothetical protein